MSGKGIDNSASQVPGNDGRYVIVITRWNEDIVTGLLKGALRHWLRRVSKASRSRW